MSDLTLLFVCCTPSHLAYSLFSSRVSSVLDFFLPADRSGAFFFFAFMANGGPGLFFARLCNYFPDPLAFFFSFSEIAGCSLSVDSIDVLSTRARCRPVPSFQDILPCPRYPVFPARYSYFPLLRLKPPLGLPHVVCPVFFDYFLLLRSLGQRFAAVWPMRFPFPVRRVAFFSVPPLSFVLRAGLLSYFFFFSLFVWF